MTKVSSAEIVKNVKEQLSNVITVLDLDKIKDTYVPTPVSVLNKHLGGGFMSGKINVLAGLPHTGKSTISIEMAAELQRMDERSIVLYFDTENAIRRDRLTQLGVDINRLIYSSYDVTLESIFSAIDQLIEYKIQTGMEDVPYMCIWDTLAFTPSLAIMESKEFQNTDEMVFAKLLKKYFVKYAGLLNKYNIQLLVLNQLRQKTGNLNRYQPTYEIDIEGMQYNMPGGSIVKFAAFQLVIFTSATSFLEKKRKEEQKSSKDEDGVFKHLTTIKASILKNKSGDTLIEDYLVFDKRTGFSELWTSFIYLSDRNIIKRSGAWYSNEEFDLKFQIKTLQEKYNTDEDFRNRYNEMVKKYIWSPESKSEE